MKILIKYLLSLTSISILYSVPGCTDINACNYDPNATVDNGSCLEYDYCGECGGDNSTCQIPGDINHDNELDILDIVITINTIQEGGYDQIIDVNADAVCNILDIVIIISWIIDGLPEQDNDEIPDIYDFESRFEVGASSVSYSGQVVRNLLARDMEVVARYPDITADDLYSYYENSNPDEIIIHESDAIDFLQERYSDISTKNLSGKIDASSVVLGYDLTADILMDEWFYSIESDGYISSQDLSLDRLIERGLLGAVMYFQASSVYLDGIENTDNTIQYFDDRPYTEMEHRWDQAFGYFGASRDYGLQDNQTQRFWYDSNSDGYIDYLSECNLGWAPYAARRDNCNGCDTGDFASTLFNAFVLGRHLISTASPISEVLVQRGIILSTWEKLIAANIIHYINDFENYMDFDSDIELLTDWSKMRGHAIALQYNNSNIISNSDLLTVINLMGNFPPDVDSMPSYLVELTTIKEMFKSIYSFTDNDLANW